MFFPIAVANRRTSWGPWWMSPTSNVAKPRCRRVATPCSPSTTSSAELVDARTAELQQLSQSLIELAEKEKAELARELHDELGANLTVAHMEVAAALRRIPDKQSELAQHLTRAREKILETTTLKRRIIEGLRPSLLESLGLAESLRALVAQYVRMLHISNAARKFRMICPD